MSIITLRKILLYNYIYLIILSLTLIISIPRLLTKTTTYYNGNIDEEFTIKKVTLSNLKLTLTLQGKEKLNATYYFKTKKEQKYFKENYHLGDKIKVKGQIINPKENTTKYLYNYKKYLSTKNIYHLLKITTYKKISSNKNIFYFIKQKIINYFNNHPYINTLLLGDKSYMKKEITKSYQDNGLSHLFAVSGMHISLIVSILSKILSKLNENKKTLIISIFLLFYLQLVGLQASVIRGVLFYILIQINKVFNLNIKLINLFILTLSITLLINPKFIYDLGFQYSFSISFTLIYLSNLLTGKLLISLLKVSLISFLVSIPISLYNFHELNFISVILNLFFVPLVTTVIFPLTVITSIFKPLIPLYNLLIKLLENLSLLSSKISIFKLTFLHLNILIYLIYIVIIILIIINLKYKKYFYIYLLFFILIIHYIYPSINNNSYIEMLDIGQGDSIIIHSKDTILIDTGGNQYNDTISDNIIIPTLKSLGIKKIKYLILTHGDYDHMGESINLVNKFKVENVIFNKGKYNYLEQELIKVLNKKKIKYYKDIEKLNLNENILYFLNTKIYDNENDNSNVIYTNINNKKILLMGDASIEVEKEIIEKYNITNIDILKVGHHGSKTSTSKEFINYINPKISLISVGEDNKFNHPNNEVLDRLKYTKIYRTDKNGSVMFNLKNKKL